jgi:hypothetical protein
VLYVGIPRWVYLFWFKVSILVVPGYFVSLPLSRLTSVNLSHITYPHKPFTIDNSLLRQSKHVYSHHIHHVLAKLM